LTTFAKNGAIESSLALPSAGTTTATLCDLVIAKTPPRPDDEIDGDGFRAAYLQMRDTHELFGILRTFGVGRRQALRLLGPEFARPVEPLALRALLRGAAAAALPLMIFVGNQAVIQIYSDPVRTFKQYGDWFNVMDPGFNLHLFEPGIRSAWVVRKPTADGLVSSLELYDDWEQPLLLGTMRRSCAAMVRSAAVCSLSERRRDDVVLACDAGLVRAGLPGGVIDQHLE